MWPKPCSPLGYLVLTPGSATYRNLKSLCFSFLVCKMGLLLLIIFKGVNRFRLVFGPEDVTYALALTHQGKQRC